MIARPFSIFQIISGAICSRCCCSSDSIICAISTPRKVWKALIEPEKSGVIGSTCAPISLKRSAAALQISATSGSIGTTPRSGLNATRLGMAPACNASTNGLPVWANDSGSAGLWPEAPSSISATSATHRPIGPSTQSVSNAGNRLPRGTRPGPGRKPTTPLKLAGTRRLPPRSLPVASGTMPVASATAEPPEEPPALTALSQGFRVWPKTGLNVCAPAHSGTFDLPTAMAPAASSVATVASDWPAMLSAKIGEP